MLGECMEYIVFDVWIFIFGIVIGSFLNVCIYRLPAGEDIVRKPSHCPYCGVNLRWFELIPVISFLIQKGKCRSCGRKLSLQYPLVELANGFLYLWIVHVAGYHLVSALYCLSVSALLAASVVDIRTYEIPPVCPLFIGVMGFFRMLLDLPDWYQYGIGMLTVSGLFLLIYLITKGKGIGGGDIKLMAAAGLLLGWKNILLALAIGSVAGCVIHISLMKLKGKSRMLAFGPYLAVGIFCAMLYGEELIDWYLRFCGLGK
ncbi:MAG: prepilin peptidase [Bacillota bacterium]|nr:prepilin peptidase [Bacillota bacterium]